jgi:uncharacterized protein YukE
VGEKEEYCANLRAKLEELEEQIAIVKSKAESAKGETKEEYNNEYELLRSKHEELEQSLHELEKVDDESWRNHQPRLEGALSELQHSVTNILFRMG